MGSFRTITAELDSVPARGVRARHVQARKTGLKCAEDKAGFVARHGGTSRSVVPRTAKAIVLFLAPFLAP